MDIKKALIKSKLAKIDEIKAEISEAYEEIECCTDEIRAHKEKIEKLEKEIEDIKNNDSFTGKPSIQYRKGFAGLSDNQINLANNWIIQHEQKYHTEYFYGLTSTKSPNYEISWDATELGDFADCTCILCKNEHKIDKKEHKIDKKRYCIFLGEV